MKIALVCNRYWPHRGGVEKYVEEIATRLAVKNQVSVLTTDPSGKLARLEEIRGVEVNRFRSWAPNESIYHSIAMLRYLRNHSSQYDIVHANNYHALPAYYAALSKSCNKLVFTPHFHGTIGHSTVRRLLHIPYKLLGKRIFRTADRVICCTEFEKRAVLKSFHIPDAKLIMIREGINPISRDYSPRHNTDKMILCVSRLEKYKGIQHVLRALPFLPNFRFTVVGSGPYGSALWALSEKLCLRERVIFKSDLSEGELDRMYNEADVAVLLSEHEQYSYFVGEALSAGIPCVVTNRDALVEWVDGESCIGIDDSANPKVVSEAVLRSTGNEVDRRVPRWDDYVAQLQTLYNDLLEH